jgi:hypothetical protein
VWQAVPWITEKLADANDLTNDLEVSAEEQEQIKKSFEDLASNGPRAEVGAVRRGNASVFQSALEERGATIDGKLCEVAGLVARRSQGVIGIARAVSNVTAYNVA